MIEDSNFVYHYVPFSFVTERLKIAEDKIIWAALRGEVSLYFVNQSVKALAYAPLKNRRWYSFIKDYFEIGYKRLKFVKGEMVELRSILLLDFLVKGILTEKECFLIHPDGGYYLSGSLNPLIRLISPNMVLNKFSPVTFDQVHILRADLPDLIALLNKPKQLDEDEVEDSQSGSLTKQEQRELVFFAWLAERDEYEVSLMKKETVWAELRKIDPRLFSTEYKNFFRDQKRIVFKSGRKPGKEE